MKGIVSAILLTVVAAPAVGQVATAPRESDIIITGVRLEDSRRQLEECLARNCPTLEDIAATLRHAEALFLQGDYRRARAVLRASISRNRGAAAQYPEPVAGLFRANARMAMHEGDGEDVRQSTYNIERSLRAGLPRTDPRLVAARLETAEMHAALAQDVTPDSYSPLARYRPAERSFREAAAKAREIGRADLAALADLRRAMLAVRIGRPDARRQLAAVAGLTGPETQVQQMAARIALARLDRQAGDQSTLDRLIAELAAANLPRPILLYAPPIQVASAVSRTGHGRINSGQPNPLAESVPLRNMSIRQSAESFDYWADIGFRIDSAGRVQDVAVLRSHGPDHWTRSVLGSISGRIYSPSASSEPDHRVERYRFTSLLERQTGRRSVSHSAQGRIEMIDITEGASVFEVGED